MYQPEDLPGTAWERDGQVRVITRVEKVQPECPSLDVYWKRPGGNERKKPAWLPYFRQWMAGAKRVEIDEELEVGK